MSALLGKAVDTVRRMSAETPNSIAQAMLELARIGTPAAIDPDHLDDVLARLAEVERGDIASEAEVEAVFRRFTR